jgi:uncharacterized protein (UPF0210 family)
VRLRAITYGLTTAGRPDPQVERAGQFLQVARAAFENAGVLVDTVRLTTEPIDAAIPAPAGVTAYAAALAGATERADIDYAAIGPARLARPDADLTWISALVDALLSHERLFASVMVGDADSGVSIAAARACARAIQRLSLHANGFGNLRFAVQAATPPGGPFFPTGYHNGGPPSFSLALDAADLAVEAFSAPTLADCRDHLIASLEREGRRLAAIAESLVRNGARFGGIDLTLAPFPDTARSIVFALERLGIAFGGAGSLAAVAFLADSLRRVDLPRCGFSGVMLPVLEDNLLAARNEAGRVSIDSLLLASTVCGTGLDTVPLPGDVDESALAGILVDMATLAAILDKPLTARLMPVPGLAGSVRTRFDFPYFANSTPTRMVPGGIGGVIGAADWIDLKRYRKGEG